VIVCMVRCVVCLGCVCDVCVCRNLCVFCVCVGVCVWIVWGVCSLCVWCVVQCFLCV